MNPFARYSFHEVESRILHGSSSPAPLHWGSESTSSLGKLRLSKYIVTLSALMGDDEDDGNFGMFSISSRSKRLNLWAEGGLTMEDALHLPTPVLESSN